MRVICVCMIDWMNDYIPEEDITLTRIFLDDTYSMVVFSFWNKIPAMLHARISSPDSYLFVFHILSYLTRHNLCHFKMWNEAEMKEKPYPSSHVSSDIIHLFVNTDCKITKEEKSPSATA